MRFAFLPVVLVVFASAASAANLNPKKLARARSAQTLQLEGGYFQDEITIRNKEYVRHTIRPGPYVAAYEDTAGTYYLGGDDCMEFSVHRTETGADVEKMTFFYDCGFYLPHDTSRGVRLFYITGTLGPGNPQAPQLNPQTTIDGAHAAMGAGVPATESHAGAAIGGMLVNAMIRAGQGKFRFIKPSGLEKPFDRSSLTAMRP